MLAFLVAVTVIVIGASLGWHNNQTIPATTAPGLRYMNEPGNGLSFLSNWDGPTYLDIAQNGYSTLGQAGLFPLYPMVVYLVNHVVPSVLDSALLVSWACFAGAVFFYIKIVKRLFGIEGPSAVLQAVTFFVLFPTAIYFIATYTESLFAMLALGAIYFALQKRYFWSALLLMLSTATHVTGVFVIVLVALILLEQHEKIRNIIFTVIVGGLGLIGYTYYLHLHLHDAFAFLRSQTQIDGWMQQGFSYLLSTTNFFDVAFIALLLGSAWYWWRHGRKSFAIYSALYLLIPIVGRQYGGFTRYVVMAFPIQLMLAGIFKNRRSAFPYAAALMAAVWTYFMLLYAGGYIGSGS